MSDVPPFSYLCHRAFGRNGVGSNPDDSDNLFGITESEMEVTPVGASAVSFYGTRSRIDYAGTGGFSGSAHLAGLSSVAAMDATGETLSALYGVRSELVNEAGTITSAIGLEVSAAQNDGTITTYTGVSVLKPAGTVTNANGFKSAIDTTQSSWRNLNITGTAPNFLTGALRVGADVSMGALIGSEDGYALKDGIAEPTVVEGYAVLYVDVADGDLKIKYGDSTVKLIVADS